MPAKREADREPKWGPAERNSDLSAKSVAALGPGRHRVARNLYLLVGVKGSRTARSWVMIYRSPVTGKRRDMGLGPADIVSVPRAKELVLRHRLAILEGRDPLEEKRANSKERPKVLSFRQVADMYISAHEASWRSPKHRLEWSSSLERYAYPIVGDAAVNAVDTGAVMRVIEPIWRTKAETAGRVRGRIEMVLDYAKARHWRSGDNPARWKGHIENLLPKRSKIAPIEHHAAVPWRELPALWGELVGHEEISALALRFTMLTATRTNEAIGARWEEIDLAAKVWAIPADRMKGGREFRVPLGAAAMAVLADLAALRQGEYVFPGARIGRPLSHMAMLMLLRRLRGHGSTVHGTVRSGFRDWASEHGIAGEVAEACLAHTIENKVEAAYRRGDLLEPRRLVAERWAQFLMTASEPAVVLPMRGRVTV
jgi:integrase